MRGEMIRLNKIFFFFFYILLTTETKEMHQNLELVTLHFSLDKKEAKYQKGKISCR